MSTRHKLYGAVPRKRPDVKWALENGWEFVRISGGGHLVFRHPQVQMQAVVSSTMSDGRRGPQKSLSWFKRNTPQPKEQP